MQIENIHLCIPALGDLPFKTSEGKTLKEDRRLIDALKKAGINTVTRFMKVKDWNKILPEQFFLHKKLAQLQHDVNVAYTSTHYKKKVRRLDVFRAEEKERKKLWQEKDAWNSDTANPYVINNIARVSYT